MACAWLPRALEPQGPSVMAWLRALRDATEEYDPLVAVAEDPEDPDDPEVTDVPDHFDEILSQLGTEIYKLDEYQRLFKPAEEPVSLSILDLFDSCLEDMPEEETAEEAVLHEERTPQVETPEKELPQEEIPDEDTSQEATPEADESSAGSDAEAPTPPPRAPSDSDSASTSWSYKECSGGDGDARDAYAAVWAYSSGYHNSDAILRRVLAQVSGGGRCQSAGGARAAMTSATPDLDGYEPVRDALTTDENIYEEIEYVYTDEGCSCEGSVEVDSCSVSASSEGVGRESPVYANLRDHDAYAISGDVIAWKNLLLDPFYNDDEEDEWITPEECAVYSREQRPPLVIPRIAPLRAPRRCRPHHAEEPFQDPKVRLYDRLAEWSPAEREEAGDSPRRGLARSRLVGSTENLFRRPDHVHLPASSSGDSLDVEVRREPAPRSRKSKSMVAAKERMKSPVPTPRTILPGPEVNSFQATVVYEGPVKRTKYSECSKKCKKNWTECYMLLTHTALVFFKDHRTYQATKSPKPPASPTAPRAELVLPLRNARVVPCVQTYTRRYARSLLITVGYDEYLLQDEGEDGAKRWLNRIQNVIYKLGPPTLEEYTPQYQSSNTDLESLGRTPPAARHPNRTKHKAGGSSNEDLSDSTEVSIQKSHVRSRLRKFFARRPAMEVLVKKGIYKDEPVFGRNLDEVCPAASPRVPDFVVSVIREIERTEENMTTDGLYRASGNLSQVQKIRLEIDQNNQSVIESSPDIHVLAGSLKLFFRELKEPLIPCGLFDRVLAACSIKPKEARVKEFRDIVAALPACNRDTLQYLLEHLLRVTQYSEKNRMHTANLAIVFGPTLLWAPAAQAHNIAIDCIQQNNVVDILLTDFKEIFLEEKTRKKS